MRAEPQNPTKCSLLSTMEQRPPRVRKSKKNTTKQPLLTKQNSTKQERRIQDVEQTAAKAERVAMGSGTQKKAILRKATELTKNSKGLGRTVAYNADNAAVRSTVRSSNSYLRELIDPINCRAGQYPDKYDSSTATFKSKISYDLDISPDNTYPTWGIGRYAYAVLPTLLNPLRVVGRATLNPKYSAEFFKNSPTGALVPIQTTSYDYVVPQIPQPDMSYPIGNYNILADFTCSEAGVATEQWQFAALNSQQNIYYGIPFLPSGSYQITVTVDVGVAGCTSLSLNWCTPTAVGTPAGTSIVACAAGACTMIIDGTNNPVTGLAAPPGVGLILGLSGGNTKTVINSVSIRFSAGAANQHVLWKAPMIQDSEVAELLFTNYRVVSQGVLHKYISSNLNDGGRVVSNLYRGGFSPGLMWFHDEQAIAATQYAHDGAFKLGTYVIWRPYDDVAMAFRSLHALVVKYPYIVVAGTYSASGAGTAVNSSGVVRLTVATNIEAVTSAQIMNVRISRFAPDEILQASEYLRTFPAAMENPLHWGAIADTLRKALRGTFSTAKSMYDYYDKNKSWLVPAAEAASSALLAL